jgi:hypothetical protein
MYARPPIDRALDALLSPPVGTGATPPRRVVVEEVLTAGYAEALELEAERLRVAMTLERASSGPAEARGDAEVARLRADLRRLTERVVELRDRLDEASRQFGPTLSAGS